MSNSVEGTAKIKAITSNPRDESNLVPEQLKQYQQSKPNIDLSLLSFTLLMLPVGTLT